MKKRWTVILMLVGTLLTLTLGLSRAQEGVVAPLGTSFTYQGRLADGGSPANGTYDFQFALYDDASNGTQVGSTITEGNVAVTDGLFTVQLDFGGGVFTGDARYLEIGVRPGASGGGYTTLTPRQALTPTPYALYARQAPWSGLAGMPAGFADGVDDDTAYSAGTGLDLSGSQFQIAMAYRLPQSCANGQIAEWDGSAWACGDDDTGAAGSSWSLSGNAGTTPGTHFVGTTDDVALELHVNGTRALRLEPYSTSPNVIGGYGGNSVASGVRGATIGGGGQSGYHNQVTANYATVGGGWGNVVTGTCATVGGGVGNTATGDYATVGGGDFNDADGFAAAVGGGSSNEAFVSYATIGGGYNNTVSGGRATIGGGYNNIASGAHATVSGGEENLVTATHGTIAGGYDIVVIGDYAGVGGGRYNAASGDYATVGGGLSNVASLGAATVGGGNGNIANGFQATIGGGYNNDAAGYRATVGGGGSNNADSDYATVGGGQNNDTIANFATIGGGGPSDPSDAANTNNRVLDNYGTIGGGGGNRAGYGDGDTGNQIYATVGGGRNNEARHNYATVPGGDSNVAWGQWSFAAGRRAKTNRRGCFVWGDSTDADVACNNNNRTIFRSTGGFYIYTDNSPTPSGLYLASGGSSWNTHSDRNVKENLQSVDTQQLLARLARMPITTWNYKSQDPAIRHVGPMAQDFNALLPGLGGEGETYINILDADGVALAAIQGLYQLSQEQAARIEALEVENAAQQAQIEDLEARLAALEREGVSPIAQLPSPWWLVGGLVAVGLVTQRRRFLRGGQ